METRKRKNNTFKNSTRNPPPPKALKTVELAIENYEAAVTTAFNNSWKQEHVVNFEVCTHFIDDSKATITNQARTFFIRECLGFKDETNGITWKNRNVTFPYFYMMPKVHKKPDWKTRPVVSGVTSIM